MQLSSTSQLGILGVVQPDSVIVYHGVYIFGTVEGQWDGVLPEPKRINTTWLISTLAIEDNIKPIAVCCEPTHLGNGEDVFQSWEERLEHEAGQETTV